MYLDASSAPPRRRQAFSEQTGQDGSAAARVVWELAPVVAVFAQRPDGHLVHTGGGEQARGQTLRQQREAQPADELVRVVGAGDDVEQGRERVDGGVRDAAHPTAGRPQLAQSPVDAQVTQLTQLTDRERSQTGQPGHITHRPIRAATDGSAGTELRGLRELERRRKSTRKLSKNQSKLFQYFVPLKYCDLQGTR